MTQKKERWYKMRIYTEGGQRITREMLDNLGNEPEVKVETIKRDPMGPIKRFITKHPNIAQSGEFKNALAKFLGEKPKGFAIVIFANEWLKHADAMKA